MSSILEIVSISKLSHDIKERMISPRKKGLTLPFDFNYWFIYNLFNHSKFIFMKSKGIVRFGFEIPLYNKVALYRASTKPTQIENTPYTYHFNTVYISKEPHATFYTENSYRKFCFK